MSFVRSKKQENPFVQINKQFFENDNLTWEAKGLMGYILSRPDNWKINKSDLAKRSTGGMGKVESALLCLLANGYVNWYPERENDGTIKEWVYDIYEQPEFNPRLDECMAEGKRRIDEKKNRNKKKNDKARAKLNEPEMDNPIVVNPETDNPEVDNPLLDNPVYNNNDFKDIDFNNIDLKEEEEEEASTLSDNPSFKLLKDLALANGFTEKDSMELVAAVNDKKIDSLTEEIILEAIDEVYKDVNERKKAIVNIPKWTAGKIENVIKGKGIKKPKRAVKGKTTDSSNKSKYDFGKVIRKEIVPDWLNEEDKVEEQKPQDSLSIEERKANLEEKLKKYQNREGA